MKITFLVPKVEAEKFTGGIYCIFRYAQGLVEKGHEVTVLAYPGSERPKWTTYTGELIFPEKPAIRWRKSKQRRRDMAMRYALRHYRHFDGVVRRSIIGPAVADSVPDSDIVIATLWETAEAAFLCRKGIPFYFIQHDESLFFNKDQLEHYQAAASYYLPLVKVANSSWLKQRLEKKLNGSDSGVEVKLCPNAIDSSIFYRDSSSSKLTQHADEINIISYGGRGVDWKGFLEMAEAVKIARETMAEVAINWHVYGRAALAENNPIASYNYLGHLMPTELAAAYNRCDILLSASWYESFPLFPIEAMACGLAVITTAPGTEDYAFDGENALIVEPKNPESVANAIVRLVKSPDLRLRLGEAGSQTAESFNWQASVNRLESLLIEELCR